MRRRDELRAPLVAAAGALGACAAPQSTSREMQGTPAAASSGGPAVGGPFSVGMRRLTFIDASRSTAAGRRGGATTAGRTLQTTVWYPAGTPGGVTAPAATAAPGAGRFGSVARLLGRPSPSGGEAGAAPAAGPFPVVVFSHGLRGTPDDYRELLTRWASAGLVVVAPAYPLTSRGAQEIVPGDLEHQPSDASFVLTSVLALAQQATDPFYGLLDGARVAAAGHSEGALTTVGLFNACCRDARLVAGIVLAGDTVGFGAVFAGATAPLLFGHGDQDPLVPIALGRRAYDAVPWPKAFLTLLGGNHIDPYLRAASAAFGVVAAATIAFLQWAVAGDGAALVTLRGTADVPGVARLDDALRV